MKTYTQAETVEELFKAYEIFYKLGYSDLCEKVAKEIERVVTK